MYRIGLSTCHKPLTKELFQAYRDAGIEVAEIAVTRDEYPELDFPAIAEMAATRIVQTMGGKKTITTNRTGTKITATRILFATSNTSVPARAMLIFRQRLQQFIFGKIRPENIRKVEFRIGRLPQQKV